MSLVLAATLVVASLPARLGSACADSATTLVEVAADLSPAVVTERISSVASEALGLVVLMGEMKGPDARWVVVRIGGHYCLSGIRSDLQSRWDREDLIVQWNRALADRVPGSLDTATALDLGALFVSYLIARPVNLGGEEGVAIRSHGEQLMMRDVYVQRTRTGDTIISGWLEFGYDVRWVVRISETGEFMLEAPSP